MDALILADGEVPALADLDLAWPGWGSNVGLVIAADGGARYAAGLGLAIDLWVGDGDSFGPDELAALVASGVPVERATQEKDESDTELAVRSALRLGADGLIVLGALGGARVDHALANIGLLAMPELAGMRVTLLDERSRITLIRAPGADGIAVARDLPGRIGDIVSLLPLGAGVTGVTTRGLRYPLADEPLPAGPARGLSNVRRSADAAVSVATGLLLVVESPARLGR